VWFHDRSLLPTDGRTSGDAFEADVDGFNFRPGRTLSPDVQVFSGGLRGSLDLTPTLTGFADINITRVNTTNISAAANASNTTDIGPLNILGDIGTISALHPFIPPEVEETRSGSVSWRRRFSEVGLQIRDNERDTIRSAFGIKGELGEQWDWTLYGTYGRFEQNQIRTNGLNFQNIRFALNIEDDGAGGYQCTDAGARAAGCVPLNIFGEGAISTAAADYIRVNGVLNQVREQKIIAASATGELLEFPSGPVSVAFGAEYRDERQVTVGDPDNAFELTSISVVPNLSAGFDVIEGFVELDIPVVDTFSVQLAARIADYSTIGTIASYNVGGSWTPTDHIRFRGQYSRSQRAPSITQFFSAPRQDLDSLLDPCDGLLADGSGITPPAIGGFNAAIISANCLSEPGIQAFFADPANAGNPFEFDGTVNGPNAGNNQLQEETANTFTVGAILRPSFIPNLSLIVDYYSISVADAIGSISTQTTAELCYGAADFPNNRFCNVITRDASSGNVIQIINRQENLNNLKSEGVDITLDYNWEISSLPGKFDIMSAIRGP
jgi:outer membrane receptor protein involved in Fe transport